MDIDSSYQEIISQLKEGRRPRIKRSLEDFQSLAEFFKWELEKADLDLMNVQKILCILDHTQNKSPLFDNLIGEGLQKIKEKDSLIYLLSVSQTHLVDRLSMEGNPLPTSYIEALKGLLKSSDLEVLEWVLRTIESLGRQSFRLHREVLQVKPGPLSFNKNKKNIREIIKYLEKQWDPLLKRMPK